MGKGAVCFENLMRHGDDCHCRKDGAMAIDLEQKRIISSGKYWDTKTIKIAEKKV